MATKQPPAARKTSRAKQPRSKRAGKPQAGANGSGDQVATDEQELAKYLEERIKPGLNRGAIPLVARSIASEIVNDDYRDDAAEGDEAESGEAGEGGDGAAGADDLEANLHKLQGQLGDDWILYFSVQGGESWLTAEKADASQRVEAENASVLSQAVKLLSGDGGRSQKKAR
jgi:hypothetical protein